MRHLDMAAPFQGLFVLTVLTMKHSLMVFLFDDGSSSALNYIRIFPI